MAKKKTLRSIPQRRAPMPTQEPAARVTNFAEVTLGYRLEDALNESERCLLCPEAACIRGCPVEIDILGFIEKILATDYRGAYDIISDANLLPAICGRVCPQEDQCEAVCPVGQTLEPVAIGRLERWIGDMAIAEGWATVPYLEPNGLNVGVVGSGPAGVARPAALPQAGCDGTILAPLPTAVGVPRLVMPAFPPPPPPRGPPQVFPRGRRTRDIGYPSSGTDRRSGLCGFAVPERTTAATGHDDHPTSPRGHLGGGR